MIRCLRDKNILEPAVGAFWSETCAVTRHGLSRRRDNVDQLARWFVFIDISL